MASKLKPCPFCGGEAVLDINEDRGQAHVYCHDCYAESLVVICESCPGKAESEVIAAWNKRVAVAENATTTGDAAKMREALEAALRTVRGIIDGTLARRNQSVFDCRDQLKAALAAPARNCDKEM